jgi:hypothetical protein
LLGLARRATCDLIEMERTAQTKNMHLNLGRELSSVAAKLRYGVSEQTVCKRPKPRGA